MSQKEQNRIADEVSKTIKALTDEIEIVTTRNRKLVDVISNIGNITAPNCGMEREAQVRAVYRLVLAAEAKEGK